MEDLKADRKRRTTTLTVELKELKAPLLMWCAARGLSPSEAVRQVLQAAMTSEQSQAVSLTVKGANVVRGARKRLGFSVTEAEHDQLSDKAGREGMSVPRWIQALIQVHLTGEGQLNDQEMLAMLESNRSMLAIGRNINQIARHLNAHPDSSAIDRALISSILKEIDTHKVHIRGVLDANRERWRR